MRRLATLLTLILVAAACRASAAEHKLFAWRVAGDPGTVYLLGSIHVGKPDLYPLPQQIEQAFAVSPELVKEIDTSGSNLALLQQQVLQRGLYTGGDKLENHLSPPTPRRSCRPGAPAIRPGWRRPPPAPCASTPNCSR